MRVQQLADLPSRLTHVMRERLPGWHVQKRWQPELAFGRHFAPPPATARRAAVLALLYTRDGRWYLPLTLRADTLLEHPRQVSLPGGAIEPNECSADAALRELNEELGITADGIQLLGELSPLYVFASNYVIAPWLAISEQSLTFNVSSVEVAELLELPVAELLDGSAMSTIVQSARGVEILAPCVRVGNHTIWGATSMVLAEVAALITKARGADQIDWTA